jgi:hypothetical protein
MLGWSGLVRQLIVGGAGVADLRRVDSSPSDPVDVQAAADCRQRADQYGAGRA